VLLAYRLVASLMKGRGVMPRAAGLQASEPTQL
jgi:hypothetical protein